MRAKFIFDGGCSIEVGEYDWIGAIAHHDLPGNLVWMEPCNDKKTLIQALSSRKVLFFAVGVREFTVDSERIIEAKAIDDEGETLLWRRAVKSSL